jgi:ABC-type transport system involved in multi-copper enzyme maturation permease subunit
MMTSEGASPVRPPATPRRPPGYLDAAVRVFDLSLGEMLWSRRSVFLALVVGGPVLIAIIVRVVELFTPALRVNGQRVGGPVMFGVMIWMLYLWFIVPILGVFYGTALIADEVDDKTITYLFTRPIPRGAVLVGKYLAYLACTVLIVLPSVMLVFFLIVPIGGGRIGPGFIDLLRDLGLIALGLAAYGGVFAFVGAQLRRPLLIGLLFAFGWQTVALAIPGYAKRLTVAYYLQSLVPQAMPGEGGVSALQSLFREYPSAWSSILALLVITLVFTALAARATGRREYVLEQ